MAIPTSITDLDVNEAMNSPAGSDNVGGTLDNFLRAHAAIIRRQFSKGANVNSASTTVLPPDCSFLNVVKVVSTINGFTNSFDGRIIYLKFEAGITLVHSGSLILPSAKNVVTKAGDVACFINESSGVWRCVSYPRLLEDGISSLGSAKVNKTGDTMTGSITIVTSGNDTPELIFKNNTSLAYIDMVGTVFRSIGYPAISGPYKIPWQFNLDTEQVTFFGNTAWHAGNFNPASKQNAGKYATYGNNSVRFDWHEGHLYLILDGSYNAGVIWGENNFTPASKANAGATCYYASGTVEFGLINMDLPIGATSDLPDPYVMTGIRTEANTYYLYPRGRILKNQAT